MDQPVFFPEGIIMSKKRRARLLLIVFLICFCVLAPAPHAEAPNTSPLHVSAQAACLIEADSGSCVYQKNAGLPLPMASTTKLMTALVALQMASADRIICVDERAVGVEGSSIYLCEGEKLTLEQLLYALLLESANDAATAIAIGLAGSVEAFADCMNQTAKDLGLVATHFTNPHGLDDEAHYTTARELAKIAQSALRFPLLRKIVSTRKTTIPSCDGTGTRLLVNHNKLLRIYDGCIGMKTGFTKRSGRCLVSAAERNGVTLIAVTINAPDDWQDHTSMLNYGFSRFQSHKLADSGEWKIPLPLVGGKESYVMLCNNRTLQVTLPVNASPITYTVEHRRFEFAGITEGEQLGRILFWSDTNDDGKAEIIGSIPLYAMYTVESLPPPKGFWNFWKELFT